MSDKGSSEYKKKASPHHKNPIHDTPKEKQPLVSTYSQDEPKHQLSRESVSAIPT